MNEIRDKNGCNQLKFIGEMRQFSGVIVWDGKYYVPMDDAGNGRTVYYKFDDSKKRRVDKSDRFIPTHEQQEEIGRQRFKI